MLLLRILKTCFKALFMVCCGLIIISNSGCIRTGSKKTIEKRFPHLYLHFNELTDIRKHRVYSMAEILTATLKTNDI